jgi:hypothetical protein
MLAIIILCILLTWLLCAAVCIGIGSLLFRFLHSSDGPCFATVQRLSLLDSLWTGLAIITAILQLYHFFRPIDLLVVFLLLGMGIAGWLWNYAFSSAASTFQLSAFKFQLLDFLLVFIAAAIIAFRCAAPGEHYDTGLYGAQAVRWFITYPLVPGLGNLFNQLGFNSSVFLCIAALDQGPWRDLAHHLFVGFLITALFASIIPAALRILRADSSSPIDWFFTLLFIPATIWGTTAKIVGNNTDLPTSVVCLVAAAFLFRALGGESRPESTSDFRPMNLVIAMVLFSLAVTFKISSIVFASLGWTVAVLKLWSLNRNAATGKRRLVYGVILSAAIVLPWIGRGLVLTGYPFFPSTVLSIPADWKVPALETQAQADFARSFARVPELTSEYAHGWNWVRPWFRELVREREGFLIPLLFVLVGSVTAIIRKMHQVRGSPPQWLWPLVPSMGGLIFWFLEAPAIRFGEPVIWTAGATLGAFAAVHLLGRRGRIQMTLAGLVLLTAWAAHPRLFWGSYFRPSVGVRTFLRLPEARVTPHQTVSGLTVYVPVETNQCWDAPLPCSPYFYETLHLRKPGKLERGFASEEPGKVVKWK